VTTPESSPEITPKSLPNSSDIKTVRIDIVSDVMCPWCVIGYQGLKQALSQLDGEIEADIHWQPFELNPNMPPEGQDLGEHITEKYGSTPEQSQQNRDQITQLGAKLGISSYIGQAKRLQPKQN
jgi:predicted DsbA family dithiol-disulfide isomerase